ncbi:MAG: LLM class flavin-dependent oxidoreductase [Gammaproteobacteria bacterium]|nr:LLM class flavin-dependent oxidoreductase [Gammaproteobacteria bacterium]
MKFGIRLIEYLGSSRELLRLAVKAEQAGFDSVWFPHDTFMRNTWVLTSAAATLTSRVRLGGVAINPYTNDPCEIATYAATLDELSGGRCILGIGMHTEQMVGWTGIDTRDYLARTRAAVDLIRRLWRGEIASSDGPCFHWSEQCYLRFKPLRADIPIYVSAFGSDYLELSGEIGDGSQPMLTPPECAAQMVAPIARGLARAGRAPSTFVVSGCAWLSLSAGKRAAADTMRRMAAYFGPYLEDAALASIGLSHADFKPLKRLIDAGDHERAYASVTEPMLRLGIVGAPRDVIAQIEQLADAGVDEIGFGGPLGPDPDAAIELMAREVIPYFRV